MTMTTTIRPTSITSVCYDSTEPYPEMQPDTDYGTEFKVQLDINQAGEDTVTVVKINVTEEGTYTFSLQDLRELVQEAELFEKQMIATLGVK